MKLSWRDIVVTLLAVAGGAVYWAKVFGYSWAVIGSWRSSVAVLTLVLFLMVAFSGFDYTNMSWLNIGEMILGAVGVLFAVLGVIFANDILFYGLAAIVGLEWLSDTGRHVWHSLVSGGVSKPHFHAPTS